MRFRIRSTSANSSGPACSEMTWPSSAPSSRTSTASGSRAPAVPIPSGSAATAADGRGARRRAVTPAPRPGPFRVRAATGSQPFRPQPSVGLYGVARDRPSDPRPSPPRAPAPEPSPLRVPGRGADQLEQLRFLHEVARLATTARTWDELLETVVDRTRDVLHADVSSLYLLDRDGAYLTLAATNGLDRFQIGRARVPFGEGVTGRVAADRRAAGHPRREGRSRGSCGSAASTSAGSWRRCCPCR